MNKEKILVIKTKEKVTISYDGKKLIRPIGDFKDMKTDEIKEWFINRFSS